MTLRSFSKVLEKPDDSTSIPGVAELRSIDSKVIQRCVWDMVDHKENCDIDHEGSGGGSDSAVGVISFGSLPERVLHFTMRLLAVVEFYFTPFVLVFHNVYPLKADPVVWAIDAYMQLMFVAGVFLRLRTGFIDNHEIVEVKDSKAIREFLKRDWTFYCDLASMLAAPFLYLPGYYAYFGLLRFLKLWRLPSDRMRTMLLGRGVSLDSFVSPIVQIFMCTHLYACLWFQAKLASPLGYGHEWSASTGWSADVFRMEDSEFTALSVPIEEGDLTNLYWCYARSFRDGAYMLIGWAGPNAMSSTELTLIGMLGPLSGCFMAYIHGVFVSAIYKANILEDQFAERAAILHEACQDMHLPNYLHTRIARYHGYLSMHHLGHSAQDLFAQLSVNLSCETRMFRMRTVILSTSLFKDLSSRVTLLLVQTCTEQVFSPGDIVVRKDEIADCMYIILRGHVAIMTDPEGNNVIQRLQSNDVFGEACFLRDQMQRTAWVRTETFVVLWRLDKEQFDALIEMHDDMRSQVFNSIVDRMQKWADVDDLSEKFQDLMERRRSKKSVIVQEPESRRASSSAARLSLRSEAAESESSETTPLMSERGGPSGGADNVAEDAPVKKQSMSIPIGGLISEGIRNKRISFAPGLRGGPRRSQIADPYDDIEKELDSLPPKVKRSIRKSIRGSFIGEGTQESNQQLLEQSASPGVTMSLNQSSPRRSAFAEGKNPETLLSASRKRATLMNAFNPLKRQSLNPAPGGGVASDDVIELRELTAKQHADLQSYCSSQFELQKTALAQVQSNQDALMSQLGQIQAKLESMVAKEGHIEVKIESMAANTGTHLQKMTETLLAQKMDFTKMNETLGAQRVDFNASYVAQQSHTAHLQQQNNSSKAQLERIELQYSTLCKDQFARIDASLNDVQEKLTKQVDKKLDASLEKFTHKFGLDRGTPPAQRQIDSTFILSVSDRVTAQVNRKLEGLVEMFEERLGTREEAAPVHTMLGSARVVQQINSIESSLGRAESYWEANLQVQRQTEAIQDQLNRVERQNREIQEGLFRQVPHEDSLDRESEDRNRASESGRPNLIRDDAHL